MRYSRGFHFRILKWFLQTKQNIKHPLLRQSWALPNEPNLLWVHLCQEAMALKEALTPRHPGQQGRPCSRFPGQWAGEVPGPQNTDTAPQEGPEDVERALVNGLILKTHSSGCGPMGRADSHVPFLLTAQCPLSSL